MHHAVVLLRACLTGIALKCQIQPAATYTQTPSAYQRKGKPTDIISKHFSNFPSLDGAPRAKTPQCGPLSL